MLLELLDDGVKLDLLAFADVEFLVKNFDLHLQLLGHLLHSLSSVDLVGEINLQLVELTLKVPSINNGFGKLLL